MSDKMMTKTEARAAIRRAREGLRWMEDALRDGNAIDLEEACNETLGAVALVQGELDLMYGRGIKGVN